MRAGRSLGSVLAGPVALLLCLGLVLAGLSGTRSATAAKPSAGAASSCLSGSVSVAHEPQGIARLSTQRGGFAVARLLVPSAPVQGSPLDQDWLDDRPSAPSDMPSVACSTSTPGGSASLTGGFSRGRSPPTA